MVSVVFVWLAGNGFDRNEFGVVVSGIGELSGYVDAWNGGFV